MKFTSALVTSASGKIFGMVASRNKGGLYLRHKSMPTNPNTPLQQAIREVFGATSISWRTLTDAQRATWATYAIGSPVKDRLGNTITLSGQQWFLKYNVLRANLSLAVVTEAPVTPGLASLGSPSQFVLDTTPEGIVNVGPGATPVAAGAQVGLFLGPALSAGVSYFKGPYQFVGTIASAASPFTIPLGGGYNGTTLSENDRVGFRIVGVSSTADGQRLLQPVSGIATVVTP